MIRSNIYEKWNVFIKAVGLSMLLIIQISVGAPGATEIIDCRQIDSSGDYVLTQDISNIGNTAVEKCITIASSNVIFDGDSHFIAGNSAASGTYGVVVNNLIIPLENVTVKNLTVKEFEYGIYINNSQNSNFTGNNIVNNSKGMYLFNSINNNIYNNYLNNSLNAGSSGSANYWNTTKQPGINIIDGPYLGGNFWASPDGSGHSENCAVSITEGICDSEYMIDPDNIDQLPLTIGTMLPSVRYINGTVKDSITGTGIEGVTVITNTGNVSETNETGFYSLNVTAGTYDLTATYDITYYTNDSVTVSTGSNAVVYQDILLVKKPTGNITGKVVVYNHITITSPQATNYHMTEIPLIVSSDRTIISWKYSLNGQPEVSFDPVYPDNNITASEGTNELIVYARNPAGTWDSNSVSFFVDSIPPESVTGLHNVSYALDYINWTWTDPIDADFARMMVYLDGVYQRDVLKGEQYYNASGLIPGRYTIGTRTVDQAGTINDTMVTNTSITIMPPERYINGTVVDRDSDGGLEGVMVSTNTGESATTDETGFYSLEVAGGTFDLTATLDPAYYANNSITVSTEFRAVVIQNIELEIKPTGIITGSVTNG